MRREERGRRPRAPRTFFEAVILNLLQVEASASEPEQVVAVARALEREMMALGIAVPGLLKTYREKLEEAWKTMFPDAPKLRAKRVPALDTVAERIEECGDRVVGSTWRKLSSASRRERARILAAEVVRCACLATLYSLGLLSY